MDLLTHVVFAYLLSFVIWGPTNPQYIAAGALAGGLPDGDALLFPLAGRFKILQHRHITHSVLGIAITSGAGSFLLPFLPYFPHASTLDYFAAMMVGGFSHTALDAFTDFAVWPFVPFSWRKFHLAADRAINPIMMAITVATLVILVEERGTVPFGLWEETAWLLVGLYGGYLLLRSTARWGIDRVRKRMGFTEVLPSIYPLRWTLVEASDTPERYRVRFLRYRLGWGPIEVEKRLEVSKLERPPGPVATSQEALERSYGPALAGSWFLGRFHHFGDAVLRHGSWEVAWYPVGFGGGRGMGTVRATVDATSGAVQLGGSGRWRPRRPPLREDAQGR